MQRSGGTVVVRKGESVHARGGTFVRIQEADSGETEALGNPEWP